MEMRDLFTDSRALKLTTLSLGMSLFICLIKFIAYFLTGSVAIYSDAMESIVNIFSAFFALIGTRIAMKPSDREHPYGHTKVEYLVAVVESLFIIFASISIFWKAFQKLFKPEIPETLGTGLLLITSGLLLNGLLSLIIYRQGKKEASPILVSHATHLFTDVLTTFGIIIGILLAQVLNFWYLDPILAILVSLNILYLGYKILKDAINSLIDVSLCQEKTKDIHKIIENTIQESSIQEAEIHDFKSRKAGRSAFIEFHLTVPGKTSVQEAHHLCDEIERQIKTSHPEIHVTIHLEPETEKK